MSRALYRKYRSHSLDEVLGQEHITDVLKQALKKDKVAHAYLLSGPRGVGKTSVARILAHEINHLPYEDDKNHLDIIEIDAASNNGVDDVRLLRDKAQILPVSASRKIYIIDEVHMLSKPAFNALLKILEEPPAHIVFILATTDAQKLPSTIISRVQQFHFHPITTEVIAKQLMSIAKREKFQIDKDAAQLIAKHSRGGFRDAIGLLDQLSVLAGKNSPLSVEHVSSQLGLTDESIVDSLISSYVNRNSAEALDIINKLEKDGIDTLLLTAQLLGTLRSRLADNPDLVDLIIKLIDVTKSPHPDLKLITIFVNSPPDKIVTKVTPTKTVAARTVSTKPIIYEPIDDVPPVKLKKLPKNISNNDSFDWEKVLEITKKSSTALYVLLRKCDFVHENGKIEIYSGTKFAKKKLDDAKYRSSIINAIVEVCQFSPDIEILSEKLPTTNQSLAEIATIMGGGEEINLEEEI